MKNFPLVILLLIAIYVIRIGCGKRLDLGPQRLEMVFVQWIPTTNPLVIREREWCITPDELKMLSGQGITGELFANGIITRGQGEKKGRVVVVLATNVADSVELRQPDCRNAIYLQRGSTFVLLPTNTPTIAKTLTIKPYDAPVDGNTTVWWIDMGSVIQGGTAIIWNMHRSTK